MIASLRRGACPGLSMPMPTGDGLLVRLMPSEPVRIEAFIGFCAAAARHGNGTVEVSARGSLQVRGLTPASAPLFAAAVADLDIAAQDGVQVVSSLLDDGPDMPIESADLAAALRGALRNAQLDLSPKVSVVVDGGSRLHLDALPADIRLRATATPGHARLWVGLGGDDASATWLGTIAPEQAVDAVFDLLSTLAKSGPCARVADIVRISGPGAFLPLPGHRIEPSPPPRRLPAEPIGDHPLRDGSVAVGIALGFGHAEAKALAELARIAAAHGARSIRPAPQRTLLLIGIAQPDALRCTAATEELGFVVRTADPRRRIAACPGAPACASGLIPARALAMSLATHVAATTDDVAVHISGCRKGCAHPADATLTVIGSERGCGIVHAGSARAVPEYYVEPADLAVEVARASPRLREVAHG